MFHAKKTILACVAAAVAFGAAGCSKSGKEDTEILLSCTPKAIAEASTRMRASEFQNLTDTCDSFISEKTALCNPKSEEERKEKTEFEADLSPEAKQAFRDLCGKVSKAPETKKVEPLNQDQMSARFAELVQSTVPVKQQVELCIFDQGWEKIENCTTGRQAEDFGGSGWSLAKSASSYSTRTVDSINVEKGIITAMANNSMQHATLVLIPEKTEAGGVQWKVSSDSTCINMGICQQ